MAGARPILAITALVLTAGAIVLQMFIILSGLNPSPLNLVYFLQSTTNGISNGNDQYRNPARWTYLAICGADGSRNVDCGPKRAAIPFDLARNFGTETGVPEPFLDNNTYYYLSRVAWAFYLIALFFSVITFFISVLAICARLGAYLTGLFGLIAFMMQSVAAALMTAWTVRARNQLNSNGQEASLGRYAYGFTWGAVAALFIAAVLVCIGGAAGKDSSKTKTSYFGRKRSTRSRGSFIDSSSDRRVKDEYGIPAPTSYARDPA
ncbi:hypothetical protein CBER1_04318 [Cercospora berteroae]|uniref:Uncharacterized protein n=1 Tax=Cercospora berteroae TaxID=357750 RepID=A0A2S6CJ69_9PEZI|nr:hypothetical protein CBER1_04318 [Cercospora berteroae]